MAKKPEKISKPLNKKPTSPVIALALGGGGAYGLAHIGVLKALVENNIPIHKVAGTSMGSIIGALYASGYKFNEMKKLATKIQVINFVDINFNGKGIFNGRGAVGLLKRYIPKEQKIEDLEIEYACNAVDLITGKEVVFHEGNLLSAVRASFSVPGIFAPIKMDDMLLVDGGLLNNVPDNIAKSMGADIVIAVDVVNKYKCGKIKTITDVMHSTMLIGSIKLRALQRKHADVIIKPDISDFKQYEFKKKTAEKIIAAGEKATLEMLKEIKAKIKEFKASQKNAE